MQFDVLDEIWFGNLKDEDARRAASASLAARTARLRGLCPFPVAAQRLLELTSSPDYRVAEVTEVIESDPALASRLLRIVNSALAGLKRPCRSVRSAVTLLGQRNLRQSALSASVLAGFGANDERSAAILDHSNVVAALCRDLANKARLPAEEAYLCGLLHDAGKLMLLQAHDDRYAALLDEGLEGDALRVKECELYGFDHGILGGQVLADWRVPDPIPLVVGWHHDLGRAADRDHGVRAMIHLVHFADSLTRMMGEDRQDDAAFFERLAEGHDAVVLGFSAALLQGMWERLRCIVSGDLAPEALQEALQDLAPDDPLLLDTLSVPPSLRLSFEPLHAPPGRVSLRARYNVSIRPSSRAAVRVSTRPSIRSPLRDGTANTSAAPASPRTSARPSTTAALRPDAPSDEQLCGICGDETFGLTCRRCGMPLCPKHEPPAGMWCRKCEDKFRTEEQGWADRTHAIIGLVLFMSAFVVLGVLVPWNTLGEVGEPLWIGLLVAFLGSVTVFAWARWSRRSAFLKR